MGLSSRCVSSVVIWVACVCERVPGAFGTGHARPPLLSIIIFLCKETRGDDTFSKQVLGYLQGAPLHPPPQQGKTQSFLP